MTPTTGTFITMDTYQGSIFDPTSLHKYLYANANPVMNVDPTGYFTLAELNVSQAINDTLEKWNDSWAIRTYHHLKSKLELIDRCLTVYDTVRQAMVWLTDPDASATDVLFGIAGGIISGIFLKKMCDIKKIGPVISKIALLGGYASQVKVIGDAIKNEQWDQVITQTFHLTLSILALSDNCFTGDTLVAAENGQIRIDEIEVGDKVWAYDIFTGETALKEVTKVYVHEVDEILHLYTSCGDIDTTTNHPFFVIDRGWVAAGDLVEGDEIYLLDGTAAYVTGSEIEKLDEAILVYNLEVADFNTYFVGDDAVLVHNYEEVADPELSYERARNKAQGALGDLGADSKPYKCSVEGSPFYGQVTGRQSADGKRRWRLDYDDIKGPHINVENFTTGKGNKSTKIAIPFFGDFETVLSLLKHLNW